MSHREASPAGALDALALALACLGAALLLAVSLVTVANAALRSFFAHPILGTDEVCGLFSLMAVVAFLPISFLDDHHLEIDLVMRGLGQRAHRTVGIAAAVAVAAFLALTVWQMMLFTADARASGDATWFLALKTWPWWAGVCALLVVALLAQCLATLRRIGAASGQDTPGDGDLGRGHP